MKKSNAEKIKLDAYEKDLEKNIEKAISLNAKEKMRHTKNLLTAADNYMKKDKRISIRIYGNDLKGLKRMAMKEGLPYQTLITSVLHKFVTGQFS